MFSVYQLLALFLAYSFLGWCVEVCFVAVTRGQVVNRGFLNGPVCPIYGVGMLGVLLLLAPVSDRLLLLFFGGMVICSLVELAGGWILERAFDTRWWDYSDRPFNLGGYICLSFSLMWGLAVTFAVRLVHPFVLAVVDWVPRLPGIILLSVFYALFLTDLVVTLVTVIGLKRRMRELQRVADALQTVGDAISSRLGSGALAADARLDGLKESGQEKLEQRREKVSAAVAAGQGRLEQQREKVSAAVSARQERFGEKISGTMEELQQRRTQLEERQQALRKEFRARFGLRRLLRAFPDFRRTLSEHLDNMDKE